jgi:bifunctional UDP-N-acetylglucosamine pyrophosphorylase/glucosamine-1-phosphate N-acetyltransferase
MEELNLKYYFKSMTEFSEKEIFDNCVEVWEPLKKLKEYVNKKIVEKEIKVNKAQIGEFVSITGNYFIDEGTKIGANVTIQGPVIIGKNVEIAAGAFIRPYTIIGDGASVGHGSEVKHAIIQNKAKVASLAFVGDSILGKSTRIGSGIILANRRFDQKNITVKINGEKYDMQADFFGAVIGDSTRLGANSVTVPGTLIGPYTWILPTVQVRGFVPAEKRIMPKAEYAIVDNPKVELK